MDSGQTKETGNENGVVKRTIPVRSGAHTHTHTVGKWGGQMKPKKTHTHIELIEIKSVPIT